MLTQLFIAAGGTGKRMGKFTQCIPKSMIEIAGKPIIDHIIETGLTAKIDQIVVGVDEDKKLLVTHLPSHVVVRYGCVEPLITCFVKSVRDLQPDIVCGCNGDTIYRPEILTQVINIVLSDQKTSAAVLLTNVVKPLKTSNWTYWRHQFNGNILVDMEEVPGHEIKTEYVVSAYRFSALQKLTENFTKDYHEWQDVPFKCYSWGWDYILKLMLWKNFRVLGIITNHLYLNINCPNDITEGQYFFKNPELFRRLRTTP